jgi:hypothetical protein
MKQLILNTSQRLGMQTFTLTIKLISKKWFILAKCINFINTQQMNFHSFLMNNFKTNKGLNLNNKII